MLDLLEGQKKLTGNQWKIAGAATLGDMLDFFDFYLISFVLAYVVKNWHLTYGQSGAILLASGISAPFGSLLYGWMADKVGRRTALIAAVLNVSIATGAMALTPEGAWIYLVVCRFFVGFGVTGLYSVDITLMQEFSPAAQARLVYRADHDDAAGRALLGGAAGGFAAPYIGWRGMFAVGLLPAFLCLYIRAFVPELPHWLLRRAGSRRRGNRSPGHCRSIPRRSIAGRAAAGRADAVARNLQISAQHHRRVPDRPHPDRRRRAGSVAGDVVCHGAAGHPARSLQTGDLA